MKSNATTYRQAMIELAGIVNRLRDSNSVDVDELVTDVARAKNSSSSAAARSRRQTPPSKGSSPRYRPTGKQAWRSLRYLTSR